MNPRRDRMVEIGQFVFIKYRRAAIRAVASGVKDGRLKRPSEFACEDCGRQAEVYDHRDYGQPMKVSPVCDSCNKRRGMAHLDLKRVDDDLDCYGDFDTWATLTQRDLGEFMSRPDQPDQPLEPCSPVSQEQTDPIGNL